jgi:hypothetical protein
MFFCLARLVTFALAVAAAYCRSVLVVEGVLLALGGALAAVTGLTGLARIRRLRRAGATAWGTILAAPPDDGEPEREAVSRFSVRFALTDGQVIERAGGRRPARRESLAPGQKVLVWYNPADPGDAVIYGREGRRLEWAFLAAGLLLIAGGAVAASLGG